MSRFIRNVSSLSSGINHKSNCLRSRSEFAPMAPALVERSPAPSHGLLNDFVRFHALASKGKGRAKDTLYRAHVCVSRLELN